MAVAVPEPAAGGETAAPKLVAKPELRLVTHGHAWRLVADDYDEFGRVRMLECPCGEVRYE